MEISEASVMKAAEAVHLWINRQLSVARDIALGRNIKLFLQVLVFLWVASYIGSLFNFDDLISILKRGKVEDNLLDFFPAAKRTEECFSEHFTKEGLVALVEYNEKKIFEVKLKDMKSALTTQITEETDINEVIETVKQRVKDAKLPDVEVVRRLWDVIVEKF